MIRGGTRREPVGRISAMLTEKGFMDGITETLDAVCLAARIVLENGGETYRAEDTVLRMCRGLGISKVDVLALPTGLMLTLIDDSDVSVSRIVRVYTHNINLKRLDDCNRVSRLAAEGKLTSTQALRELKSIYRDKGMKPWLTGLCGALAAAFFSAMLGGGFYETAAALVTGAIVQFSIPYLLKKHIPVTVCSLIMGFVSAITIRLLNLLFPQINAELAIVGAILPLLPGLAMTNAIRDTIRGDLVSGGARLTEASLMAVMVAVGIYLAMLIGR